MATKKNLKVVKGETPALIEYMSDPSAGGDSHSVSIPEYFESRASFVRRVATEVLLSISARRNNGVPVGGDELAAVASANRLAKELGIQ